MTTIATEINNMNAATVARKSVDEAAQVEDVMSARLAANPNCPLAAHDFDVASSAFDNAVSEVERLGGNW